jgi:hypothetical protein
MYVGGLLILGGFGLYVRSVSIVLFAAAVSGLAQVMVVFYEEPTLKRKFGQNYEEYCRVTPRWIPRTEQPPASGMRNQDCWFRKHLRHRAETALNSSWQFLSGNGVPEAPVTEADFKLVGSGMETLLFSDNCS